MPSVPDDTQLSDKAKLILAEIDQAFGLVPNLFRVQAEIDPDWLELNWKREQQIMLKAGALDRKTKELIAMTVALLQRSDYCSLAHEALAGMVGASQAEINEAKQVIELFSSFSAVANTLCIPCDIFPPGASQGDS